MHVNKIGGGNEFVIPDLFEQHGPGQQLLPAAHHVFQEAKLARKQIDHAIAASRGALDQVKFERPRPQRGRRSKASILAMSSTTANGLVR